MNQTGPKSSACKIRCKHLPIVKVTSGISLAITLCWPVHYDVGMFTQSMLCRTLAMIKPDAVQHLGQIVDAVLQSGFILR